MSSKWGLFFLCLSLMTLSPSLSPSTSHVPSSFSSPRVTLLSLLFSLRVIIPASISSHQSTSSLLPFKLPSSSPFLITPSHPPAPLPLFVARETAVHSVAVNLLTLSFYYLWVRCLIRRTKGWETKERLTLNVCKMLGLH